MSRMDRAFALARQNITAHGVHINWVGAGGGEPSFAYTVGLAGRDHPELIVFGAGPNDSQWILNNFAFRVRDGVQRFDVPQVIEDFNDGYAAQLIEVPDSSKHLTLANRMYRKGGAPPIRALQVVFPDKDHLWPWEEGSGFANTPVLGSPLQKQDAPTTVLLPHEP